MKYFISVKNQSIINYLSLNRKNPTDDVASIIANAKIDNRPINHLEALSYYVLIATAGHDTTSSATAGGLLALIENKDEFIPPVIQPPAASATIKEMEKYALVEALKIAGGNVEQAGKALGISRATIYRKIKKYQIE